MHGIWGQRAGMSLNPWYPLSGFAFEVIGQKFPNGIIYLFIVLINKLAILTGVHTDSIL